MIEWSLEAFRLARSVNSIVVACPPGRVDDLGDRDLVAVEGGATRSQSVRNALASVETEFVAIHDAARPLVTAELVEGVVATLAADPAADGAIAATPVVDTIKRATPFDCSFAAHSEDKEQLSEWVVESSVDRSALWAAQTPQVFRTAALRAALDAYPAEAPEPTDEAMLIEAAGGRVLIHPAPPGNLKVTTPEDLRTAQMRLSNP